MSSLYRYIRLNPLPRGAIMCLIIAMLSILYLLLYFPEFLLMDRLLGISGILCLCSVVSSYISEKTDNSHIYESAQNRQAQSPKSVADFHEPFTEDGGLLKAASEFNKRGDHHAAIAACNEALKSGDNKDAAYLIRGIALLALGLNISAVEDLTTATGLFPMNPYIYLWRAKAYQKCNLPKEAIDDCNLVLGLSPDSSLAYKVRGEAHASLGNFHQALFDYQSFMSKCPPCSFKHKTSALQSSENDIINALLATV